MRKTLDILEETESVIDYFVINTNKIVIFCDSKDELKLTNMFTDKYFITATKGNRGNSILIGKTK